MMGDKGFAKLVVDLLAKEDRFEKALTMEHVEDKLINKQIILQDEEAFLKKERVLNEMPIYEDMLEPHWNIAYQTLEDISLLNRQRRNFRYCRDWNGERPW